MSIVRCGVIVVAVTCLFLPPLYAQDDTPLEITGFADVYAYNTSLKGETHYQLGQVEFDLERPLSERFHFMAAIAYDQASQQLGLGAMLVTFHWLHNDAGRTDINVGQFDVPFGIDWRVYPSVDRELVSAPLAVALFHQMWNDYGIWVQREAHWYETSLYVTNGFNYQHCLSQAGVVLGTDGMGCSPADSNITINEIDAKLATGGRFAAAAWDRFHLGVSGAWFFNQDNEADMSLYGADLQLILNRYTVKGEYLYRTLLHASGAEEVICQGFYAQGMYDLDRFYFVGRYGHVIPHDPSENDPTLEEPDPCTRITTGAGWRIQNNVQARLEYQHNSRENEDAAFLQLIVAF